MASQNQTQHLSLSRSAQKQITRQKLLDATVQIIAEEGIAGMTLAKVAQRTGLSRGICNFHFKTKKLLLLEAFRMLYAEHESAWRTILSDSGKSPEARLQALIRTLLTPPIADHTKLAVWLAFWGVPPHRRTYLEICEKLDREYETEVENLLRKMANGKKTINGMSLKAIAVTLTSMVDGFWVNYLISPGCLPQEDAVNACLNFLSSFYPSIATLEQ
ncbi:MAG: TetR family transcriptional regulator C-terminal domain-containing protein [Desulfobacterium sp.]